MTNGSYGNDRSSCAGKWYSVEPRKRYQYSRIQADCVATATQRRKQEFLLAICGLLPVAVQATCILAHSLTQGAESCMQ